MTALDDSVSRHPAGKNRSVDVGDGHLVTHLDEPTHVAERITCDLVTHTLVSTLWQYGVTRCQCGTIRLPGAHTMLKQAAVYDGTTLVGWDRWVDTHCTCHPDATVIA